MHFKEINFGNVTQNVKKKKQPHKNWSNAEYFGQLVYSQGYLIIQKNTYNIIYEMWD